MKRLLAVALTIALLAPASALAATAEEEFDPAHEFELKRWGPELAIGPIDMSLNKAVAYLFLGTLTACLIGILLMRGRPGGPDRRQTVGELIYEVSQTQIAEQGLPSKAVGRWFPYVATLLLFIWSINVLGFLPLPLSDERFELFGLELPTLGIYAATAQISVPLVCAIMTVGISHYEGIRWNGARKYFKTFIPDAPLPILMLLVPIEVISQLVRIVSLSIRLYANMLAGHMLILVMIGLIFVLEHWALAFVGIPVATLFYLFEVVIVVTIQAYIFAALSAIYIGSAIEPEH